MEHGVNVGRPVYSAGFFQIDFAARIDGASGTVGVLQFSMRGPAALAGTLFTSKISGGKVLMFDEYTGEVLIDTSDFNRDLQAPALTDLEQAVRDAIVNTEANSGYFDMDGNVAVFVRVSSLTAATYSSAFVTGFQSCRWAVMVQQPEEAAFAGLQPMTDLKSDLRHSTNWMVITLGIIMLVVLVWVLVGGFLLSRSITKPVTELRDAAEKISMGDMSVDIPAAGDDEIGDLSESFGRMVAAMKFLYQEEKERGQS
jgi:HAMP domain-containing protein